MINDRKQKPESNNSLKSERGTSRRSVSEAGGALLPTVEYQCLNMNLIFLFLANPNNLRKN